MSTIKSTVRMAVIAAVAVATSVAQANLLTNGGFEDSTSPTATPPGWTNVGHSDGVITYASFGTPAYEGRNYYDLGGYGDASGPIGDGIAQTFATTIGSIYSVIFGLSSENSLGIETLTVAADGTSLDYVLGVTGDGVFMKPFSTQTFNFTATGSLTTLSFIHTAGAGGSNDPMIDNVIVDLATSTVPEPETLALVFAALAGMAVSLRRRNY